MTVSTTNAAPTVSNRRRMSGRMRRRIRIEDMFAASFIIKEMDLLSFRNHGIYGLVAVWCMRRKQNFCGRREEGNFPRKNMSKSTLLTSLIDSTPSTYYSMGTFTLADFACVHPDLPLMPMQ